MNNIERIFEAVCNILSVYVSFKVTDVFLEKKRKLPRMANIVYVLVWLINTVVAFGFRNAMGTTVSMVLLLWAAEGILYEGSILQKIMAGCFTVLLGLTIEFIMYYYLGDFSLFSEGRAMGTITGAMVNLLIAMGIRQVICRRRVMETQNYYFMILVLAGNIVWIYALESVSGENSPKTVLSLAIMIVVDLGMFYLYDRLGEAYQDKMQQRLLKEHMMVYQEQMHIMQQDQKKLDSLRHDMKNHMYLLQTYLNEGRYDKAQEYVNKMSEHLQTEHKYVNTGNLELDMILNHKLAKAEAMSCQIQSQIVIPCQLPVDGYDWNVLFGSRIEMNGSSMKPVLESGDVVLMNRLSYDIGKPNRLDVVVFEREGQQPGIKRIIGLPGETVQIKNGSIYINGELLKAQDGLGEATIAGAAEYPVELGEDEYFLLGDNRESSEDSRFSGIGNIKRENLIGRVWLRFQPFSRLGFVR